MRDAKTMGDPDSDPGKEILSARAALSRDASRDEGAE